MHILQESLLYPPPLLSEVRTPAVYVHNTELLPNGT